MEGAGGEDLCSDFQSSERESSHGSMFWGCSDTGGEDSNGGCGKDKVKPQEERVGHPSELKRISV